MLPYLNKETNRTEKYIVQFRGINYGEGARDGEMSACENLSTEKYPFLVPRRNRTKVAQYTAPHTLHTKEGLLVIDDTTVYYNGNVVGTVEPGKKQVATVGRYIVIFPDKVYYDVTSNEFASMEAHYSAAGLVFSGSAITTTGEDWPFRVGDAVEIAGCAKEGNNKTIIVRGVEGKVLTFYDYSFEEATESGTVTVSRNVPDLDFICESNYRLWGTKDNTIYASKYSDPFNFNNFDGLTSDSYFIDVGSDGKFTGCIPYSSHICFFKENVLHKLYGSKPSNYQVVTTQVQGVQEGSERSLCVINEQLFYKGVHGVYAYSGGIPSLVSECFDSMRYSEAAAASDSERYYISMRNGDEWHLFSYDVRKDIWLREDATHALDMTVYDGEVYFIGEDGGLYLIDRTASRDDVEWSATFCTFNETMDERKGYNRFNMRIHMESGAWLAVDLMTDEDGNWREVYTHRNERARTLTIPIIPTRCDSVTIRVRGSGDCTIKAFIREFTVGSDVV